VSESLLQIHERAPFIAGAQTSAGKALVWLAGCGLLAWHGAPLLMLPAFTLVLLWPRHRRGLLALAALGMIAARFLPQALPWDEGFHAGWLRFLASTAIGVAAVLLMVWGALRFDRLPAAIRARPILWLHVLAGIALATGVWTEIWLLTLAPVLLWRASYLYRTAAAGRAAGTRFRDHLMYLMPVFGGTNTPYGKGLEYLNRTEARTPEAFARSQLAGIRLLLLAVALGVLLDLLLVLAHGQPDTLFRGAFAGWSPRLPTLGQVIATAADPRAAVGWAAVYLHLIVTTTKLATYGHVVVGALRLLGFNVFRNTYKPLYSTSIVEFWNRFYYYFKELLVEMFFYPAFYRSGWASPRVRILIAVLAAAFAGNAYYHLLRDYRIVFAGDWPAIATYWIPRLIYCLLLAIGIWLSMLRQQELRKRSGPPAGGLRRLRAIAGVWTYFGLLQVWLVEPEVAGAARRSGFFASLAGF